jgi:anti-anti-sigma factor
LTTLLHEVPSSSSPATLSAYRKELSLCPSSPAIVAPREKPGRHRLHLDLGGVRIPTASGLGALVALHEKLRRRGGRLVLSNVQPWAYEVFSLTRLTEVLDVRPM